MRKYLSAILIIAFLTIGPRLSAQEKGLYLIKNCQRETIIDIYYNQIRFFWWWSLGNTDFQRQRLLKFAPGYQPDSIALRKDIEKLRALLPPAYTAKNNFSANISVGLLRDNKPDEKAIWFTEVFAEKDKSGVYKVYAAYKITFEGTDARLDHQRKNAMIKNILFIFDEASLKELSGRLAALPVTQDIHK